MKPARQARERDIIAYFKQRIENFGGEVRKVQWVGRKNAPDYFVMLPEEPLEVSNVPAVSFFVEFKAPGEKPTPAQLREHERMRRCGVRVEVVSSYEEADTVDLQ